MDPNRPQIADSEQLNSVLDSSLEGNPATDAGNQYAQSVYNPGVEALQVHQEGVSVIEKMSVVPHASILSRRKVATVSLIITLVITFITALGILLIAQQNPPSQTDNQLTKPQDIALKNTAISQLPKGLEITNNTLVIHGDIVTRGNLQVSSGGYVTMLRNGGLTSNQILTVPNSSGTICLDSNNCGFATTAQLGQIAIPPVPASSLVNNQAGAVTIQGSTNQISVTTTAGTITLSTPQDLAAISSPTFASLLLNGTLTLPLNCTTFLNGGSLTTDGTGQVMCADDETSGAGTSVTTPGGTPGTIPVFTAADVIADSIISQALGIITINGDLAVNGGDITSTGALTLTPNAGSNLNVVLSGTGDFAVNTNQLYVDTSTGNVGIGDTTPVALLTVGNGDLFQVGAAGNIMAQTNLAFAGASGSIQTTGGALSLITPASNPQILFFGGGGATEYGRFDSSGRLNLQVLGSADNATYICRNSSNQIATCNTTGTGAAYVQGGNTFGAPGDLGTNDAFALNLRTAGSTRLSIDGTNGNVGIGTAPSPTAVRLSVAASTTSTSGTLTGSNFTNTGTPSSAPAITLSIVGLSAQSISSGGNVNANTQVVGLGGSATNSSANTLGNAYGVLGQIFSGNSITTANGLSSLIQNTGTGTFTTANGILLQSPAFTSSGAITTAHGVYIQAQDVAGVGTGYGIYQEGSSDLNYFAGNVGIGDTTPAALFTVGNGDMFQVDSSGRIGMFGTAPDPVYAIKIGGTHPGTGTATSGFNSNYTTPATSTGFAVGVRSGITTAAAAFTVSEANAYDAISPVLGAGSAITNMTGMIVRNQGASGVTNAIGLSVDPQSGASTLNIAAKLSGGTQANLWLNSNTASGAGGIAFGTSRDVNLYRSAADLLQTDDGLIVGTLTTGSTAACFNGSNQLATCTGSGANTLQGAYDGGNTITGTSGRNISITLADLATDQTLEITQAGTADAFRVNDDGTFGDTTPFVIDASGNVGVGTAVPGAKLDVVNTQTTAVDSVGLNVTNNIQHAGSVSNSNGSTSTLSLKSGSLSFGRGVVGNLYLDGSAGAITPGQVSGIQGATWFSGANFTAASGDISAVEAAAVFVNNQTYTAGTFAFYDTAAYAGGGTTTVQDAYGLRLSGLGSSSLVATNKFAIDSDYGTARFLTGAAGNVGEIIRGAASQTADLLQLQNSSDVSLLAVNASGNLVFEGSATDDANETVLTVVNPTADITYRLADAAAGTYDLCSSAGNCLAGGGAATLQSAYNAGNTITGTTGRNISITLADLATDQTLEVTQAGTADAFRVNDDGTFSDTTPFVIDASGNVGIGITAPTSQLYIQNNQNAVTELVVQNTTSGTAARAALSAIGPTESVSLIEASAGYTAFTEWAGNSVLSSSSNASGDHDLIINTRDATGDIKFYTAGSAAGNQRVVIDSTGNVGIGDTTPASILTVGNGDLFQVTSGGLVLAPNGASGAGNLAYSFVNDTDTGFYRSAADALTLQTGGVDRFSVSSTGVATFNTTSGGGGRTSLNANNGVGLLALQDTGGTSVIQLLNAGDNQLRGVNNADFSFYTNNTEKMRILAGGNVGIGDTSPAALLTVGNGDLFQVNSSGNISTTGTILVGTVASTDSLSYSPTSGDFVLRNSGGNVKFSVNATGEATSGPLYVSNMLGALIDPVFRVRSYDALSSNVTRFSISSNTNTANAVFENSNVGIGDTSPAYALTVGNGDLFGVQGADGSLIWEGTSADVNETVLTVVNPTADLTYRLADAAAGTYDLCSSAGNCLTGGGAATLQSAYNAGNTITGTTGRNISITLADLATDQTLEITQAGTADAFRVNDDGTFSDTTAFVIDQSGNVGVGVSPSAKLHVIGNTILGDGTAANGHYLQVGDDIQLQDIDVANTINFRGVTDATVASIRLGSTGGTISGSSGNVGIGTTTPATFKLEVAGHIGPSADDTYDLGSDARRFRDLYLGPATLHIGTSTSDEYKLTYDTTNNTIELQAAVDAGEGFQVLDADGGIPVLNVDTANERVGIGMSAPTAALDVNGDINLANYGNLTGGNVANRMHIIKGTGPSGDIEIGGFNNGDIIFSQHLAEIARFDASGQSYLLGNFGIGATAPNGLLQVTQSATGLGAVTTNGTTTLTGNFTNFLSTFRVGDFITVSGETVRQIATISSDTSMTVTSAFSTSASGLAYTISTSGGAAPGSRLTVKGYGYVGIGTASPTTILQVDQDAASLFGTSLLLNQSANGSSDGVRLGFDKALPDKRWTIGIEDGVSESGFSIAEDSGIAGFGTPRLYIATGGNVGIGSTNPSSFKLQVAGHIGPETDDIYDLGSSARRWRDLYLGPTSLHIQSTAAETITARDYKFSIQETAGATQGNFRLLEGASELLTVTPTGNFGIGATNPGAKLEVTGNILFTKDANRTLSVDNANVNGVNGGSLTISAGSAAAISTNTASGGDLTFNAGSPSTSNPGNGTRNGNITFNAGSPALGDTQGGNFTFNAGGGNNGNVDGGHFIFNSGNGSQTSGGGGYYNITTGSGAASGSGGAINLTTGNGGASAGNSGSFTFRTGTAPSGTVGSILFQTSGANTRLAVDGATGNIGIGDASPASLLTVGDGDDFQVNSTGAIAAVTGYTQGSGNFAISGSGTFGTGTGAISLNGDITIAGTKDLTIAGGNFDVSGPASGSSYASSFYTNSDTNIGLAIAGNATGTADLLQLVPTLSTTQGGFRSNATLYLGSNGNKTGQIDFYGQSTGGAQFLSLVAPSVLSTNTITLPNATGTVCISGQTCATSGTVGYWSRTGTILQPATSNDALSITGNSGDVLTAASSATGSANKALNVSQTGATSGTDYGGFFSNTGAATTNVGIYATATGATNNYAAIFEAGNVGIGDSSPAALLTVGSGDLFQVNGSGSIIAVAGISGLSGNITPNSASTRDLGSNTLEFNELYIADNNGIRFGLDQDATLAYDESGDDRMELTGSNADLFIEDKLTFGVDVFNITDDGVANDTLTPTTNVVRITIDEAANGGTPDLVLSESGAKDGDMLIIINAEADGTHAPFTMTHNATVLHLPSGSNITQGHNDTIVLIYSNDRWLTLSRSIN